MCRVSKPTRVMWTRLPPSRTLYSNRSPIIGSSRRLLRVTACCEVPGTVLCMQSTSKNEFHESSALVRGWRRRRSLYTRGIFGIYTEEHMSLCSRNHHFDLWFAVYIIELQSNQLGDPHGRSQASLNSSGAADSAFVLVSPA